jgi:hypothetical protein
MMDIVTAHNRESPLDRRANPQMRGAARRSARHVTASKRSRRVRADCVVIAALITAASSVLGAAQLPATTWLSSERAELGAHGTALTALRWPAPAGEVTPTPPPQIPPPAAKPSPPPVAAPPPRTEQPQSPPRQPAAPPPPHEAPPPEPEAPAPQPEAPAPEPEAPAPQPEAPASKPEPPPPEPETPPSLPPPRGHVQLAP